MRKRTEIIDNLAKRDSMTKDKQYNDGLRLIRKYGYRFVSAEDAVKYYCMCNAL